MWPTFAAEVLSARASLRLGDEIGLAFRAERQRLGMSQRAYAAHRGWTLGTVIRLESAADALKLGDVDSALADTRVPAVPVPSPARTANPAPPRSHAPDPVASTRPRPNPTGATAAPEPRRRAAATTRDTTRRQPRPQPVHPAYWPRAELIARVRGGRRRFPAHHVTEQIGTGPPWWWYAESSRAGTVAPDWYAPQYTQRRPSAS